MKKDLPSLNDGLSKTVCSILVAILLIASLCRDGFAQAKLIKDINRQEKLYALEYSQLSVHNNSLYFVSRGKELWKTNGTPSTTVRIKGLGGISNSKWIQSTLYFSNQDGSGNELWRSDGTAAGTIRLKDIRTGAASSNPNSFTEMNGVVYFVANNGAGDELWKTNGTAAGTVLVKDIRPGPDGSSPKYLTPMNGHLYFTANDGVHGVELWKSDGTSAGTVMVRDITTTPGTSAEPRELTALNGTLYFSAWHEISGRELWKSNGTASGTARIKDIHSGANSAEIHSIRAMGSAVYFDANNGTGTALWRSDGTFAGTIMIKDLHYSSETHAPLDMTVINNRIYFAMYDDGNYNVWVSNGTAAGTKAVWGFHNYDVKMNFTELNGRIYFFSAWWDDEAYTGFQELKSMNADGTSLNTIFEMRQPFSYDEEDMYSYRHELIAMNGKLYFWGVLNENSGFKLLTSDGTPGSTTVVYDTYKPTESADPRPFVKVGEDLYVSTIGEYGYHQYIYKTNGTDAGTKMIKQLQEITHMIAHKGSLYFGGFVSHASWQLWKTDGTAAGTILLKQIENFGWDHVETFVSTDTHLYFKTPDGQFWRTDGTVNGTIMLKDFHSIHKLGAIGSSPIIIVGNENGGLEVWKSNGSVSGTVKFKTIRNGSGKPTSPYHPTALMNGVLYFVADDGVHGWELWRTNGTFAGTYLVKDINTGPRDDYYRDFGRMHVFKNALYMTAADNSGYFNLWKSDGTTEGTGLFHESLPITFINHDDQLLFITQHYYENNAVKLYKTDGTEGGTQYVQDLQQQGERTYTSTTVNGITYITYGGSQVIWRTDGTSCGTYSFGVGLKEISPLTSIGTNLVFNAYHSFYGSELFSYSTSLVPGNSCPDAATMVSAEAGPEDNIYSFPNPFNDDITVRVDGKSPVNIRVFNDKGFPVQEISVSPAEEHRLGQSWRKGTYLLRIEVDDKVLIKRVIKED